MRGSSQLRCAALPRAEAAGEPGLEEPAPAAVTLRLTSDPSWQPWRRRHRGERRRLLSDALDGLGVLRRLGRFWGPGEWPPSSSSQRADRAYPSARSAPLSAGRLAGCCPITLEAAVGRLGGAGGGVRRRGGPGGPATNPCPSSQPVAAAAPPVPPPLLARSRRFKFYSTDRLAEVPGDAGRQLPVAIPSRRRIPQS